MPNIGDLLKYRLVTVDQRPAGQPEGGRVQKDAVRRTATAAKK